MSAAVRGLQRVAFGMLGARRVVISCDKSNIWSIRVAEGVGCQLEGRLRNEDWLPSGELGNTRLYSTIDTDEAVRRLITEEPLNTHAEFSDNHEPDYARGKQR
jgi:RimJ/RimL family protein N-acetyltransferase